MTTILTFTLATPAAVREVVELADDGRVVRWTGHPGGTGPVELGWWRGAVDADVAEMAATLAAATWPDVALSRPPAAGGWTAAGAASRRGLWAAEPGDEVGGALRTLLAECSRAADEPVAVAALGLRRNGPDDPLLLDVASVGVEPIGLTLRDARLTAEETVVFITEEAEVLGYLGSELVLEPGTTGIGVLRGREADADGLAITGTMSAAERERVPVGLRLTCG